MNFYDNIPNFNSPIQLMNPGMINNSLDYKIQELENKIKKLEFRISRLENEKNNNYNEPDTSLYML